MPGQVRHYLLSRGRQNNFADDDKMVTLLDARTGAVVRQRQSTKSAFAEEIISTRTSPWTGRDRLTLKTIEAPSKQHRCLAFVRCPRQRPPTR